MLDVHDPSQRIRKSRYRKAANVRRTAFAPVKVAAAAADAGLACAGLSKGNHAEFERTTVKFSMRLFCYQQQCSDFLEIPQLLSILEPLAGICFWRGTVVRNTARFDVFEAVLFQQRFVFRF